MVGITYAGRIKILTQDKEYVKGRNFNGKRISQFLPKSVELN